MVRANQRHAQSDGGLGDDMRDLAKFSQCYFFTAFDFAAQPGFSHVPVAHDCVGRDFKYLGDLLVVQTTKEAQLDHSGFAWINRSQAVQGLIQRKQICGAFRLEQQSFFQWQDCDTGAAFDAKMSAGMIHQNLSHGPGSDGKKVGAVLPLNFSLSGELEISLIDQSGGLQCMAGTLVTKEAGGHPSEVTIHERRERIESVFVALTPANQDAGNFSG